MINYFDYEGAPARLHETVYGMNTPKGLVIKTLYKSEWEDSKGDVDHVSSLPDSSQTISPPISNLRISFTKKNEIQMGLWKIEKRPKWEKFLSLITLET